MKITQFEKMEKVFEQVDGAKTLGMSLKFRYVRWINRQETLKRVGVMDWNYLCISGKYKKIKNMFIKLRYFYANKNCVISPFVLCFSD